MQEATQELGGKKYCSRHFADRTCNKLKCDKPREPSELQLPYCKDHIRCNFSACKEYRRLQSRLCEKHKCLRDDCQSEAGPVLEFCPKHTCKGFLDKDQTKSCSLSIVPFNNESKRQWSDYCGMHTCQLGLRMNTGCSKFNENHAYCSDHRCGAPDCDHPRLVNPADLSDSANRYCARRKCLLLRDRSATNEVRADQGLNRPQK